RQVTIPEDSESESESSDEEIFLTKRSKSKPIPIPKSKSQKGAGKSNSKQDVRDSRFADSGALPSRDDRMDRLESIIEKIANAKQKSKAKVVKQTIVQMPAYANANPNPTNPNPLLSQLKRKMFLDI
ncbi:MAG: hypothetical protein P4M14_05340, partial [Gammaproteobacteria bacterium]|nr:hypothetical protein [Gammaproteobacteria bacterium]